MRQVDCSSKLMMPSRKMNDKGHPPLGNGSVMLIHHTKPLEFLSLILLILSTPSYVVMLLCVAPPKNGMVHNSVKFVLSVHTEANNSQNLSYLKGQYLMLHNKVNDET